MVFLYQPAIQSNWQNVMFALYAPLVTASSVDRETSEAAPDPNENFNRPLFHAAMIHFPI